MKKTLKSIVKHPYVKPAILLLFGAAAMSMTACSPVTVTHRNAVTDQVVSHQTVFEGLDSYGARQGQPDTYAEGGSAQQPRQGQYQESGNYANTSDDGRYQVEVHRPTSDRDPMTIIMRGRQPVRMGHYEVPDESIIRFDDPRKTASIETTMLLDNMPRLVKASFRLDKDYTPHISKVDVADFDGTYKGQSNRVLSELLLQQARTEERMTQDIEKGRLPAGTRIPPNDLSVLRGKMTSGLNKALKINAQQEGPLSQSRVSEDSFVTGTQDKVHRSNIKVRVLGGYGQNASEDIAIRTVFSDKMIPGGFTQDLSFRNDMVYRFDKMAVGMMNAAAKQNNLPLNAMSIDQRKPFFEMTVAMALLDYDIANYPEDKYSPTRTGAFRIGPENQIVAPSYIINPNDSVMVHENGAARSAYIGDLTREQFRDVLEKKLATEGRRLAPMLKNNASSPARQEPAAQPSGRSNQMELLRRGGNGQIPVIIR